MDRQEQWEARVEESRPQSRSRQEKRFKSTSEGWGLLARRLLLESADGMVEPMEAYKLPRMAGEAEEAQQIFVVAHMPSQIAYL